MKTDDHKLADEVGLVDFSEGGRSGSVETPKSIEVRRSGPVEAPKSIEVGRSGYVEAPKSIEVGRSGPVEAPKSIEVGRSRGQVARAGTCDSPRIVRPVSDVG